MRKKYVFLSVSLFLILGFWQQAQAAEKKEEPRIRVLLAKEAKGVLLEARGGYKILQRDGRKMLSHGTTGKRFVVHAISSGIRWGEEFPGIYAISIFPLDAKTSFYVDGLQYKGAIHVYCTKKGFIHVVNEVSIEDFVASTMSVKLTSPLSQEAINALAIAARTNAYSEVFYRTDASSLWDLLAKECGYLGMGVTMSKNGVDEAVLTTKHIVLEEKGGMPTHAVNLSAGDAEKLALKGLDAKRILRSVLPHCETAVIASKTKPVAQA